MSDLELSDLDLTLEEIKRLKKELEEARKEKKEREERERLNPFGYYPSTYGWVCPVCGKGNAPFSLSCPCKDVKYYWSVCPVCGKGNAPFSLSCPCKDVKYYWSVTM